MIDQGGRFRGQRKERVESSKQVQFLERAWMLEENMALQEAFVCFIGMQMENTTAIHDLAVQQPA
jgi:hypothetical protein